MGLRKVFGDKVPTSLPNMSLLSDDLNASTATRSCGLHDVHVLEALHLPFIEPALIIFGKYICGRCYVIVLTVSSLHTEDISPEIILSA